MFFSKPPNPKKQPGWLVFGRTKDQTLQQKNTSRHRKPHPTAPFTRYSLKSVFKRKGSRKSMLSRFSLPCVEFSWFRKTQSGERRSCVWSEKHGLKKKHMKLRQRGSFAPLFLKLCHVEVAGEEQTSLDEFRKCSNVFNEFYILI